MSRKSFAEDCVAKQSISVTFMRWQESTIGNYIEFKIRVRYLETTSVGTEASSELP